MARVPEDELNPSHGLGAEATASDIELKKDPQAKETFKVLQAAWDMVNRAER
jgi:hypothetical protein